jgi:hypothetical protein
MAAVACGLDDHAAAMGDCITGIAFDGSPLFAVVIG